MITINRITPLIVLTELSKILGAIADNSQHVPERDRLALADIADLIRQAADKAVINNRVADVLNQDYPGPRCQRPIQAAQQPRPAPRSKRGGGRTSRAVPDIIAYLSDHADATTEEIAAATGLSGRHVVVSIQNNPALAAVQTRRDGRKFRYSLPAKVQP